MRTTPVESFEQLLGRLKQLLEQKSSGTVLIATTMNTSIRFALQRGQLTHCTYYRLHGDAALRALIQDVPQGRLSFLANTRYPFKTQALLEHQLALQILFKSVPVENKLSPVKVHPSGFTEEQLLQLFGRFYFE